MLSKQNKVCKYAFLKGYRIINGCAYSPKKRKLNPYLIGDGYLKISIRVKGGKTTSIPVHKLVAYQKYGNKLFKKGIQVRHFNGKKHDNTRANIRIGTSRQNNMDKPPEVRLKISLRASSFVKKYKHEEIVAYRNSGATYKEIMSKFGVKNKSTLSFIINKSIASRKQ